MARTPLLRALRQLAGEHDAAEQLGVPVEELRARREEQAYSRKDFLKRTGAIGAALAAAGPAGALVRSARGATAPRIAIVGGGIAGLTTRAHAAGRRNRVDGLRSPSVADRRPHALRLRRLSRLLGQRPGQRAVRRADRHRPQDDPRRSPGGSTSRPSTCSAPSRTARPTRTTSSATTTPPTQADSDFKPIHAALHRDLSAASYPTTYKISTPEADRARQHEHLRLDRVPRARRPLVADRPAARRRLQHRVRRRDDRAVARSTSSTCSATSRAAATLASTASPTSATTSSAATSGCPMAIARLARRAGRFRPSHGLTAELGEGERRRHGRARRSTRRTGTQTVTPTTSCCACRSPCCATLDYGQAPASIRSRRPRSRSSARGTNCEAAAPVRRAAAGTRRPVGLVNGSSYADTGYQNTWDVTRAQAGRDRHPGRLHRRQRGRGAASPAPYATAATRRWPRTRRRFLDQLEPVFPGITARWNGKATLSTAAPRSEPRSARTRTGSVGQYTPFSGYEGVRPGQRPLRRRALLDRTSRATWRAAPPRACVRRSEILADLKK